VWEKLMMTTMRSDSIAADVATLDELTKNLFSVNPGDAPDGRAFKPRGRQPIELTRAKTRLRTAAWRKRNAELKRATGQQLAMAVLKALATARPGEIGPADFGLVRTALTDLRDRGFDVVAAAASLKRLRARELQISVT
jgi:hypothetical protein